MMICESCERLEAHPKSIWHWCTECERSSAMESPCLHADQCNGIVYNEVPESWEVGDPLDVTMCESCQRIESSAAAMDKLRDEFDDSIKRSGWEVTHSQYAATGTKYFEIFSECTRCHMGGHSRKVRLADHATAYCSEDFSIVTAGHGSGDDIDVADLGPILDRIKEGECEECSTEES